VEVNGKSVEFCNGWRGVEGGIYDYNSGVLKKLPDGRLFGATVYLSTDSGFSFAICDELLTGEELEQAERMVSESKLAR
jgi:hypothetical protein